jgi:hypothetical protein
MVDMSPTGGGERGRNTPVLDEKIDNVVRRDELALQETLRDVKPGVHPQPGPALLLLQHAGVAFVAVTRAKFHEVGF